METLDIYGVVDELLTSGQLDDVLVNPLAQFGPENQRYVGAEILPEQNRDLLMYEEMDIAYRTVVATAQSRYSPPVLMGAGQLVGKVDVKLGHSGIARQFTGQDYDAVTRLLRRTGDAAAQEMEAAGRLLGFVDVAILRAMLQYNEAQRWQAMVYGQVIAKGANGFREVFDYVKPAGHRVAAGGDWSNAAYDPWADVLAMVEMLADKGYTVSRIITSRKVVNKLMRNVNVARRAGGNFVIPVASQNGQMWQEYAGRMTQEFLMALAANEGLPPFEIYDGRFRTETGNLRFLPEGCMVFICETGRDQTIAENLDTEDQYVLANTLGYTAIGPISGEAEPGRRIIVRTPNELPKRIEFEAMQASIPVIQDPEAFAVISGV